MQERNETPATTEEAVHPPAPRTPRRARRLKRVQDVRAFVASILRQVELGSQPSQPLDPSRARVLLYGAQILGQLIQGADVEERLVRLERLAARGFGARQ